MKLNKKHLIIAVLLPIQVVFVQILRRNPNFIERYYSEGIYPYISTFLRFCFGWLPFSFGDALGVVLLILLVKEIYALVKFRFKNILPKLIKFTAITSVIYFCFYFFWGLNYFREPLGKELNLKQSTYTDEQLINTAQTVLHNLNAVHKKIVTNDSVMVKIPYSNTEIYAKALVGYKLLSKKHSNFTYVHPSIKSSLVSLFQSYGGTSGYINPITNEAQINHMIPKTGMPATVCHEIAHQIGWGAENEANFVGFLTAIFNKDTYFKYSGYRMAFRYCFVELRKRDKKKAKKLWNQLHKGIQKDFENSYHHWKQFENPIEPYLKKGYNSYLKANNQQKGIDSYNYVVDLLISFYESLN